MAMDNYLPTAEEQEEQDYQTVAVKSKSRALKHGL
jgi:hypothetical protein